MKEHPILFSGPMVRAILDGRKTQTRRIARLNAAGRVKLPGKPANWHCEDPDASKACPYGQPGDRLWVRETWCPGRGLAFVASREMFVAPAGAALAPGIIYRADGDSIPPGCHWRPSIHMPRWASRILLDVVSVRVERLQQLTNNDAACEGFDEWKDPAGEYPDAEPWEQFAGWNDPAEPWEQFAEAWNRLNSKRATWASNPWVWVVEFGRVL